MKKRTATMNEKIFVPTEQQIMDSKCISLFHIGEKAAVFLDEKFVGIAQAALIPEELIHAVGKQCWSIGIDSLINDPEKVFEEMKKGLVSFKKWVANEIVASLPTIDAFLDKGDHNDLLD